MFNVSLDSSALIVDAVGVHVWLDTRLVVGVVVAKLAHVAWVKWQNRTRQESVTVTDYDDSIWAADFNETTLDPFKK